MNTRRGPRRQTRGDVIRINITPASTTFPWLHFHVHRYGIRFGAVEVGQVDMRKKTREEAARAIGEKVIQNSRVLRSWTWRT